MPLFDNNNKCVFFVHIPKTGGTALVNFFRQLARVSFYAIPVPSSMRVSPQHMPIGDVRAMMAPGSWSYSSAVVRDPYTRLESEYYYRATNFERRFGYQPDFSTWAIQQIEAVSRDSCHLDNHLRRQTDFLDEDVEVFRYENGLDCCAQMILQHLELDRSVDQIPRVNASARTDISWSMSARLTCNRYYESDFSVLGYKMIEPNARIRS
jgi:hypothetical protein